MTLEPTGDSYLLQGFTASFEVAATGETSSYDTWAAGFPGTNPDAALDIDNGGLATGIEWVTGGDPSDDTDDSGLVPASDITSDPDHFLFIFARADEAEPDANTIIEVEYGSRESLFSAAVGP